MPDYKNTSYSFNFNRSKLTRAQQHRLAGEAAKTAKSHMIPDNGGVNLLYDPGRNDWMAQYVVETPCGRQQVGWSGNGRNAFEAVRDLERNNHPHPLLVQQMWEQQDSDGKANEQPNKLN